MYIYHAFINALSAYRAPLLSAVPLDQIRSPGWWYQINVCVCVCVRERERERERHLFDYFVLQAGKHYRCSEIRAKM